MKGQRRRKWSISLACDVTFWTHHQKERPTGKGKESLGPEGCHNVPPGLEAIYWSAGGAHYPSCYLLSEAIGKYLHCQTFKRQTVCLSMGDMRMTHPLHQVTREVQTPKTQSHDTVLFCFQSQSKPQVWGRRGRFNRWPYNFRTRHAKKLVFTVTCLINHQHLGYVILLSFGFEIFPT